MTKVNGLWDKNGRITEKGLRFMMTRLNVIRKELKKLKDNDFSYTVDVQNELRDMYHNYTAS